MSIDVVGHAVAAVLHDLVASAPHDAIDMVFWNGLMAAASTLCRDCAADTTAILKGEGRRRTTTMTALGNTVQTTEDAAMLPMDTATATGDVLLTSGHVRDVLHRFTLMSPWDLVALTGCSIDVVVRQLLATTAAGATELVFAVCCSQCAAECGRWPTVHAVYHAFRGGVVKQCRLCANDVSLCGPHSLQRIKVFFAPVRAPQSFPMVCGGVSVGSGRSSIFEPNAVCPPDTVTQLHLAPQASVAVMSSTPFLPFSSTIVELYIPRGRYLVLIADVGITLELHVHADPVRGPELPMARVLLPVASILTQRLSQPPQAGTTTLEAKHGWIRLELVNASPVCGVLQLMPYADRRFIWMGPDVDGAMPSRERLFPVTALMSRIPGGLSNGPLVQVLSPPPASRLTLPSSYVAVAFNLGQLMECQPHPLLSTEVTQAIARVVEEHHGLVVESATDLGCVLVVFRSPTAAVAATLCLAKHLLGDPAHPLSLPELFAAIVEGPLEVECVPAPSLLLPMSPLRFNGLALDGARRIAAQASLMPLAAQGADACVVALATASSAASSPDADIAGRKGNGAARRQLQLGPFRNTTACDALVAPLLDMLPFKFNGVCVEPAVSLHASSNVEYRGNEPPVLQANSVVFDPSLLEANVHQTCTAFSMLSCPIATCLGGTECIALPVVLEPSMVDPYESACSDSL